MKRPKDYLIFPLDVPTYDEAIRYVELLKGHVGLFKVGLELFVSVGPKILRAIRDRSGSGIFLDLKFHDIPASGVTHVPCPIRVFYLTDITRITEMLHYLFAV